jgi:hypothetical protein
MSIANGSGYVKRGDIFAMPRALDAAGIPLVVGRLDKDGNPIGREWNGWQDAEPGNGALADWQPDKAIAFVSGHGVDVLDRDPRNDPSRESWNKLAADLGEDGPAVLGVDRTASGGRHVLIPSLGLPKRNGFLPGIDYLGGAPDGTGRALVFIPPTVRPSKATGRLSRYVVVEPFHFNGDGPSAALAAYLERPATDTTATPGRAPVGELRHAAKWVTP